MFEGLNKLLKVVGVHFHPKDFTVHVIATYPHTHGPYNPCGYPQTTYTRISSARDMGRIDAVIDDDLEKKVRIKAVEKFGGKKGSLTEAIEEALEDWAKSKSRAP